MKWKFAQEASSRREADAIALYLMNEGKHVQIRHNPRVTDPNEQPYEVYYEVK